jgi:hypothetical protein
MTLPTWKKRSTSISLVLFFILSSCGTPGTGKIYSINAAKGGFVRQQENEILPFEKTEGYFCESPEDFGDTVACVAGAVNVYKSKPARSGIYRSQANELILYIAARGYLCVSPADMKQILDNCATKPVVTEQ